MAGIVTQKDTVEIIKSNIALTRDILLIINNTVGAVRNVLQCIDTYVNISQKIYGTNGSDGLLNMMVSASQRIDSLPKTAGSRWRRKIIDGIFNEVKYILRQMVELSWYMWFISEGGLDDAMKVFNVVESMSSALSKISYSPAMEFKLMGLRSVLERFMEMVTSVIIDSWKSGMLSSKGITKGQQLIDTVINMTDRLANIKGRDLRDARSNIKDIAKIFDIVIDIAKKGVWLTFLSFGFAGVKIAYDALLSIIKNVSDSIGLFTGLKMNIYISNIKKLDDIIWSIAKLGLKGFAVGLVIPGILAIEIVMKSLVRVFVAVQSIKTFLLRRKLRAIANNIHGINKIIRRLRRLKWVGPLLIIKMKFIEWAFNILKNIFITASVTGFFAGLFALAAPLLILGIYLLVKVLIIMSKVALALKNPGVIKGILLLTLVSLLMTIAATSLLVLSLVAMGVLKNIFPLFAFLLALIPIILIIIAIGYVASLVAIVAMPAVVGTAALAIMVGAILLMALELKLLEHITLDKKAIHANVRDILNLAKYIISHLFDEDETGDIQDSMDDSKGYFGLIKGLFSASPLLIKALASSLVLVMSIISVAAILIIAAMFLIIAELKINKDAVLANVGLVIELAKNITDLIFGDYHVKTDENGASKLEQDTNPRNWFVRMFSGLAALIGIVTSSAFLLSTVISTVAILLIVGMFQLIQKMDIDKSKVLQNIGIVSEMSQSIIDLIFGDYHVETNENGESTKVKNAESRGWLCRAFEGIADVIGVIMSSAFLLFSLLSISLVLLLAKELKHISEIDLNPSLIESKINDIMTACNKTMGVITAKAESPQENDGFWGKVLNVVDPRGTLSVISSMGHIAMSLACVGLVKLLADQLVSLEQLPELNNVESNVDRLMNVSKKIINDIIQNKDEDLSRKKIKSAINIVSNVMKIFDPIEDADFKNSIIESRLNLMDRIYDSISRFGEVPPPQLDNYTQIIDKNIELLEKIDDVKFKKLKMTTKLFENISEFSESIKGNFDGLAGTLNDKIAPLMEELKELLKDVEKTVEKSSSKISRSAFNSGRNNLSESEMKEQVAAENPNATPEHQNKLLQQRLAQQSQQNNQLISKIDELIDLFRDGRARVSTY